MHYCAENTSPDLAQLLIKAEPELVNQADEEGYTPLHLAVIAGNRTMLRYLLDHGAEVNLLDNERHSVVHWATVCGELESLDVVLDSGAEASVEDIHGAYPIHYAAQMCGHSHKKLAGSLSSGQQHQSSRYSGLSALKKLINHGVPVDVIDRDGRQPLLWAASSGTSRHYSHVHLHPICSYAMAVVSKEGERENFFKRLCYDYTCWPGWPGWPGPDSFFGHFPVGVQTF